MRDMAKIVTVKSAEAIPGKDRVQTLTFNENGYTVLGDKGIVPGQQVIFVEVDSLLPIRPEFEFLRARCYKENLDRFLIRPLRMCGVISMGIVFKTTILPERKKPYQSGEDVSGVLNILKYEPVEEASTKKTWLSAFAAWLVKHPATRPLGKGIRALIRKNEVKAKSPFPSALIAKSDETTVQNCPEILEAHLDTHCYATIKMEGQSGTFLFDYKNKKVGKFFVCSRTVAYRTRQKKDGAGFWDVADAYHIPEALQDYYKKTGKLLAIQGERCGPGVQKNIYRFPSSKLFLYTARDLITNRYLSWQELADFSAASGIPTVPAISEWVNVPLREIITSAGEADAVGTRYFAFTPDGLDYHYQLKAGEKPAFEKNSIYYHEGIVIRGMNQEFSFKVKSPDYAYWFS
ncbi:hypothetical protein AGMMS50267_09760 [Spirochaetia bacterium]|nr:hypothetical protein AGMMS50267_09760 [Spirochaetia bacterium]